MSRSWFAASLVAALTACSDGTAPTAPAGTLRFTYQGEIEGSFDVTGAYPPPGKACDTCAFSRPTVQGNRLGIAAYRERDGLRDILTVTIPYPAAPGRYVADAPSDFAYGIPAQGVPEYAFRLVSAEVVIAEIKDGRIRGEFTGQGEDFAAFPETKARRVEIVNGTFDLPVLRR